MRISRAPLHVRYFLYSLWVPAVLIARTAPANLYVVDQGNNRVQKLGDNGVFDVEERLVRTLLSSGDHVTSWDGRNELGMRATPGIYVFRLESAGFTTAKSTVLLL